MSKLQNIKRTGVHAYRFKFIAKLMCKRLCKQNRTTYWVLSELGCHTVICFPEVKKLNKIFRNNSETKNVKPMDAIKLNRICSYKSTPTWIKGKDK